MDSFVINLYSIRDDKSGFTDPVSFSTDFEARESFRAACKVLSSEGRDIKSFSVYRIGTYDVNSALLCPLVPPAFICSFPDMSVSVDDAGGDLDA